MEGWSNQLDILMMIVVVIVGNPDVKYGFSPHLTKVDCVQRAGKWLQRENGKIFLVY